MSEHTKGPWKVDEAQDLPLAVIRDNADGFGICEMEPYFGSTRHPECIANAHMIAAAPDLLEACKEADTLTQMICELLRSFSDDNWAAELNAQADALGQNARAAIAKAVKC